MPERLRLRRQSMDQEKAAREAEAQALLDAQKEAANDKTYGHMTAFIGSPAIFMAMYEYGVPKLIERAGLVGHQSQVYAITAMLVAFASYAPTVLGGGMRDLRRKLGKAELYAFCAYIAIEAVKNGWEKYGAQLGM